MDDRAQPTLGSLLYSVRPLPTATPLLIAAAVVLAIDALVFFTNNHSLVLVGCATGGALVVMLAAGLSGYLELHRIYEHAIVVGLSWPLRSTQYVISVSSVDPASVRVHYRANMIARRLGTGGSPTMRMAVYSTRAVSFTGESWATAADSSAASPWWASQRVSMLQLRQSAFGRGPLPETPVNLWVLGVRRPDRLLRALEQAFAADGHPEPRLADRALQHPVVEPSGRPLEPRT